MPCALAWLLTLVLVSGLASGGDSATCVDDDDAADGQHDPAKCSEPGTGDPSSTNAHPQGQGRYSGQGQGHPRARGGEGGIELRDYLRYTVNRTGVRRIAWHNHSHFGIYAAQLDTPVVFTGTACTDPRPTPWPLPPCPLAFCHTVPQLAWRTAPSHSHVDGMVNFACQACSLQCYACCAN